MKLFEQLQALDRRWIYLVLAIAIVMPLIIPFNSRTYTTKPTEDLYKMIDSFAAGDVSEAQFIEKDRAVLLSFSHDASTMPELFPMELAILRHCFERNIKVFTMTFLATAAPIMDLAINTVKEEFPHIQSGVHYANFGYKVPALFLPIILGMGDNIAEAVDIDAEGRKLSSLPIMTNIKNYNNMNLVVEFSGSAAGGAWIVYARSRFGVNVAVGVTAVMAADNYPFLQTGQLIGMLAGLKGAAEYEKMVDVFAAHRCGECEPCVTKSVLRRCEVFPRGREFSKEILRNEKEDTTITDKNVKYKFKQARIGMNAQSIAHILIIVFILIGNIGYFMQKYSKKNEVK
jgi:hypothetical protein